MVICFSLDVKLNGIFFALFFVFSSCQFITQPQKDKPIARVHEKHLYESDILEIVPFGTAAADSAKTVQVFIHKWIEQQLILAKAELNLPEEKKNVEQQIENYRNSLLIYAYEKELVRQKLDTNITEEKIEEYYQQNKHNFELKDYIVKVIYVKLEKNSPQLKKVKKWYQSDDDEDFRLLEEYCRQFAVNFFLDVDVWLYFDDLLKEIPIENYNKEQFLKSGKTVEMEDNTYIYLLNILDYKLKDDISPLSFEQERIKNIIINQRKIELIKKMKEDIYEDALERGNFEVYEN